MISLKQFLVKLWNNAVDLKNKAIARFWIIYDFFYRKFHKAPDVAGVEETIDKIVTDKCSVSRFGDGEIKLIAGKNLNFQKASPDVSNKLKNVLSGDDDGIMICIADMFNKDGRYNEDSLKHWKKHLSRYRREWYKYLRKDKKYYNASMTRQYIDLKDKSTADEIFKSVKRIWDGREIVIIEGEMSRLGVENDLFDNAKEIHRIVCPSVQAFSKYDEILAEAKKVSSDKLILLALGPCATVLAYDLNKLGYQAVDIGHIDIEYEWFLMGAEAKVPVKNKIVNEAVTKNISSDFDRDVYEEQVIARIL